MPTNRLRRHAARESQENQSGRDRSLDEKCAALWNSTKDVVTRRITEAPMASLGAALAVGVFVGWMIKRR